MNFKEVQIDKIKWFSLSLAEQLGNAGSEIDRYLSLKARGDEENAQIAFFRAIDLLDLTKQFDYFQNYFMDFALLARKKRLETRGAL